MLTMLGEAATAEEAVESLTQNMRSIVMSTWLVRVRCIAITGRCTAGVGYVTRNWARDEHAFIWSDFKDAVKENWKQGLVISLITGLMPLVAVSYTHLQGAGNFHLLFEVEGDAWGLLAVP